MVSISYLLPVISLLIISYITYETGKRNHLIWFFYAFTLVSLTPVVQIFPLYSIFAERYAYLASIGSSVLIAYAIDAIQFKKIKYVCFVCITTAFCLLTINHNRIWNNTVVFWKDVVDHTLPSVYAYRNLAGSYYIYKDYQKAADLLALSATIQPRNLDTYKKLYYLYKIEFKDEARAAEVINQAVRDFPEKADVIKNQLNQK
jgi:tetratricopeptide (TPR) repeat protein